MTTSIALLEPAPLRRRQRVRARVDAAQKKRPALRTERLEVIRELLRLYREHPGKDAPDPSPLVHYIVSLRAEVEAVEAWAESRGKRAHHEGSAIRQTLTFLREFGRMTSLQFALVPVEERPHLVTMLALEHRWCYAAAGTTRDVFKLEIGRTGAR